SPPVGLVLDAARRRGVVRRNDCGLGYSLCNWPAHWLAGPVSPVSSQEELWKTPKQTQAILLPLVSLPRWPGRVSQYAQCLNVSPKLRNTSGVVLPAIKNFALLPAALGHVALDRRWNDLQRCRFLPCSRLAVLEHSFLD